MERIKGFAVNVGSVVPTGFAAYARILHPAYREGDEADWHRHPSVTWAEVARANGRVLHPQAQFGSLEGLEVLSAEVSHGITAGSDQVNPVPAED